MTAFASRTPPLVSVAMIAYNHERFIRQAIESVLAQRTSFPIELVVGDDASFDGTARHIEALQARAPDVVRPIIRPENIGMHRNVEGVLEECRGEFVAFLEGDDYWTAYDKLQTQVDILRACENIVGVFHPVAIVDAFGRHVGETPFETKSEFTTRDWLAGNLASTASVVLRRSALLRLPDGVQTLKMRDWPMWVFASLHGPWRFLPDVMAAYRVHEGGAWSSLSKAEASAAIIEMFEVFAAYLPPPFSGTAWQWLAAGHLSALDDALDCGRYAEARRELRQIARLLFSCRRIRDGRHLVSASWLALSPRSHRIAKGVLNVARTRFGSGRNGTEM
jgi:Glycosyl transferase family 2